MITSCVKHKAAMVIGTTGLTASDHVMIDDAAKTIPILQASNSSLVVNVLLAIVAQTAQHFGSAYDNDIVEALHNQKMDFPPVPRCPWPRPSVRSQAAISIKRWCMPGTVQTRCEKPEPLACTLSAWVMSLENTRSIWQHLVTH